VGERRVVHRHGGLDRDALNGARWHHPITIATNTIDHRVQFARADASARVASDVPSIAAMPALLNAERRCCSAGVESIMTRAFLILSIVLVAAPAFAQSERGYISGIGGLAISGASASPRTTSGDLALEAGARIAPSLLAFGNYGRIDNLTPTTSQTPITDAVAMLSTSDALGVQGTARTPAQYVLGGLRWQSLASRRVSPFVSAGLGVAHLTPNAVFTYASGTLPGDATQPNVGDDVTSLVTPLASFTPPQPESALMLMASGGAEFAVATHWAVDTQYSVSRISASTPLHAQGLAFGFGYRF
jgi:hypothetical protein